MMRKRIALADFETPVLIKRYTRSLALARALDDKAALPPTRRPADHDFESFLNVMTPQRLRLLKLLMRHEWLLGELAVAVERDRSAVRRDVSALESLGLVVVAATSNPGHGVRKVVRAVATRLEIVGELAP
jgi:predicted transcriptional regulator